MGFRAPITAENVSGLIFLGALTLAIGAFVPVYAKAAKVEVLQLAAAAWEAAQ